MTMKKRKKNNRLSFLTAIVCLLLFAGVLFLGMKNYEPEKSENPVQGVNSESSLKGYLGKGYAYAGSQEDASTGEESSFEEQAQILEDEPEEEPEKKREEAQATVTPEPTSEPEASQTPEPDSQKEDTQKGDADPEDGSTGEDNDSSKDNTIHYDKNGDQDDDSRKETPDQDDDRNQDGAQVPLSATPMPSPEPEPTQEPEEDHYPTIATDLTDGETVNAAYRTFYVQAVDWYGNSLSSTALEVYGNGERLSSKGEPSPGILAYRLDLNEGSNTVDIKAMDDEGWSTTLPTFTIYKGDESQEEPAGSITVSIEAGTVGLGTILPATSIDFYQGEQLSSVVLRLLQNSGFDWRNDGSATGGFYLKAIGRGGITSGASIPDDLMAHLTEVNCQLSGHDANWLGEFDFTMNSGWMYFVNGEYMNIGMSGYFPADGDEVRLRFTLYSGADLGVGDNGEVWGDW